MGYVEFDHYELTMPEGSLTTEYREEIDAFWCDLFGWSSREHFVDGKSCHMLKPQEGQFILLAEAEVPLQLPAQDVSDEPGEFVFVPHLGVRYDRDEDIERLFAECLRFREKDSRVRIKEYPRAIFGDKSSHSFLVNYLLPTWFDVHWFGPTEARDRVLS